MTVIPKNEVGVKINKSRPQVVLTAESSSGRNHLLGVVKIGMTRAQAARLADRITNELARSAS